MSKGSELLKSANDRIIAEGGEIITEQRPPVDKTIQVGKIAGEDWGYKRPLPVEIDVKLSDGRLSICGSIWKSNRSDILSGGQNLEEIATAFPNNAKVQRIVEVWRQWHLNDMKAGTPEQEEIVEAARPSFKGYPASDYEQSCEVLKAAGMYEIELDGKPYRYGTAWLTRELPFEIILEVESW